MRQYELHNNEDMSSVYSTCGLIGREVCLHDSMQLWRYQPQFEKNYALKTRQVYTYITHSLKFKV